MRPFEHFIQYVMKYSNKFLPKVVNTFLNKTNWHFQLHVPCSFVRSFCMRFWWWRWCYWSHFLKEENTKNPSENMLVLFKWFYLPLWRHCEMVFLYIFFFFCRHISETISEITKILHMPSLDFIKLYLSLKCEICTIVCGLYYIYLKIRGENGNKRRWKKMMKSTTTE